MNKNSNKNEVNFIKYLKTAFLGFRISPLPSGIMVLASFFTGPLIAIATLKLGELINSVPAYVATKDNSQVMLLLACMLGLYAAGFAAALLSQLMSNFVNENMQAYIIEDVMRMTSRISYLDFISKKHRDSQYAILDYISVNLSYCTNGGVTILRSTITFISYTVTLYSVVGILPAAIGTVVVVISAILQSKLQINLFNTVMDNSDKERHLSYIEKLFRNKSVFAEMILFNFGSHLQKLYKGFHEKISEAINHTSKKNVFKEISLEIFIALASVFSVYAMFRWCDITTAGQMTVALTAYFSLIAASRSISHSVSSFTMGAKAAIKYVDYCDEYVAPINDIQDEHGDDIPVKLEHVSFSYGEKNIINDISLTITPGQTVAIVGENGAGKTTLVNIILGLFPCEGKAKVFGKDAYISRMKGENDAVAVLQQTAQHLGYTVGENIGFDKVPNSEELKKLDSFFEAVDLTETVGEMLVGRNFSGGQWQKIALARCLTSSSRLAILDEPTAALDPMAEAEIFANFMNLSRGRANIMITHRLGAIRNADMIYVLKDGRIFEHGTHEELMNTHGYYADMFNSQAQWYIGGEHNEEAV